MAEFDLIEVIRSRCAVFRDDVRLGIGDDAALLAVPNGHVLAASTDTLVAGVHFPHETSARDIGWKALAVNLSDLAAMGATPAWATLALTLPAADVQWVAAFADGFAALAGEFKLALVGGDTTQGPLAITVGIFGFVPEQAALRRSAAKVGDAVFVTGTLGDAAAGLRLVRGQSARRAPISAPSRSYLIGRLDRPTPRVPQGLLLRGTAHACIDVSDGLLADLGHLCAASGVGADINLAQLPASPALLEASSGEAECAAFQLGGGDDYELCFTAPEGGESDLLRDLAHSGCAATRIGRIVADRGLRVRDRAGNLVAPKESGWQHFSQ